MFLMVNLLFEYHFHLHHQQKFQDFQYIFDLEFNKYLESVKEKVPKISAKYPTFEVIKNKNRISLKELINRSRNKSEE